MKTKVNFRILFYFLKFTALLGLFFTSPQATGPFHLKNKIQEERGNSVVWNNVQVLTKIKNAKVDDHSQLAFLYIPVCFKNNIVLNSCQENFRQSHALDLSYFHLTCYARGPPLVLS